MYLTKGCRKDLIMVVDESNSMLHNRHDVLNFLAHLVDQLDVSSQDTHVSLGTFSSSYRQQFDLNHYHSSHDLKSAIRTVRFHGGTSSITEGLSYILRRATTPSAGDRAHVPDVVLFITDHTASSYMARVYGNLELHNETFTFRISYIVIKT